nr:RNA polymerase sigma factor [[Pseudomonas] sp. BICA1-14]
MTIEIQFMTDDQQTVSTRFAQALKPYAADIYRTAYRLTGNRTDAQDLVQELFIKLFQQFDSWSGQPEPVQWIRRVLYNLHIDLYRKRRHIHGIDPGTLHPDENILDSLASTSEGPDHAAERAKQQLSIQHALNSLDVEQRALVVLHLIEGHTLEEASAVLLTPLGTLKSRLHRCKIKLRTLLKKDGTFF